MSQSDSDAEGCCALLGIALAIALVVAVLISIAALVDPFDWMPPVGQIWEDCEGECDLADRFPGFWGHAVANLVWAVATATALVWVALATRDFREARLQRFDGATALKRYETAVDTLVGASFLAAALGLLPVFVAIL